MVDQEARLVRVKHQHNVFTTECVRDLTLSHGRWVVVSSTNNVEIDHTLGEKDIRQPDISFWSYKRLVYREALKKRILPTESEIPDVVIQFSWKNTKAYETEAINDMMNLAKDGGKTLKSTNSSSLLRFIVCCGICCFVPLIDRSKNRRKRCREPTD